MYCGWEDIKNITRQNSHLASCGAYNRQQGPANIEPIQWNYPAPPVTPERQKKFDQQALKAVLSAELPFDYFEEDEMLELVTLLNSAIKLPTRRQLIKQLLDRLHSGDMQVDDIPPHARQRVQLLLIRNGGDKGLIDALEGFDNSADVAS